MKLSDYVISFLEKNGVKDIFLLSGGGMMHLLDSVNSNDKINKYYNLNEQASSYCADTYAQATNKLGVCMVTTGPGATNAITGMVSAHLDSSPVLVISGQVRTDAMIGNTGARQVGAQEVSIVPIVESYTKYAVTVMKADEIKYNLEKAVYLATHGRKGAVWVDIPLDIQAAQINENELIGFTPEEEIDDISEDKISELYKLVSMAKRPVILAGSGVFFADASESFAKLANYLKIPVLSTYKFREISSKIEDGIFYGSPGVVSARYSNYILQNSDLLIVIGSGLRYYTTAFNEANFAPLAKKININVDITEISKLKMDFELIFNNNALTVIEALLQRLIEYVRPNMGEWEDYCKNIKRKYPVKAEIIRTQQNLADFWAVYESVKGNLNNDDVLSTVNVSRCKLPFLYDFIVKEQQRLVQPCGLGAMGQGIPAVIAACIALDKKRTIMFEGDGSLQHNIQELALIKTYDLPIKLFIDNNGGYSQIYGMQSNHFKGRLAGCNPESGVCFPNLEDIAKAYGIEYVSIKTANEIEEKVKLVLKDDRAVICEMFTQIDFPEVLVTKSRVLSNGQMASSSLEDLFPFLPEEEHSQNMIGRKKDI